VHFLNPAKSLSILLPSSPTTTNRTKPKNMTKLKWLTNGEKDFLEYSSDHGIPSRYLSINGAREVLIALTVRAFGDVPDAPGGCNRDP